MTKNITFSEANNLIDADVELPLKKRRDLKSSISTFLRATGKPATLPFTFLTVRHGMKFIDTNRGSLKRERLYNIRNHLKFVLERYDAPSRSPMRADLTPEWSALCDLFDKDNGLNRNLSRFMHWASARELMPSEVSDEVMEDYREDLELRTFLNKPAGRFRETCKAWNQAREQFPEWPNIQVTVPSYRKQISPAWDGFPASFIADLDAYARFMTGGDLFAEDAPAPRREVTITAHREHFRRLAGALVRSGTDLDSITNLAMLVEPANIKTALNTYQDFLGRDLRECPSIYEMMAAVRVMARDYVKVSPDAFRVINLACSRLHTRRSTFTDKNRDRLRPFRDPFVRARFLNMAHALDKEARILGDQSPHAPRRRQTAFMHEILLIAPIRLKNLCSIHLERNIRWHGNKRREQVFLTIPRDDVKNAQPLEFEFPLPLVNRLRHYLDHDRPMLIKGEDGGWLFPGDPSSGHKHAVSISDQMVKAVSKHVGIRINCHLYRHIAAYFYLQRYTGDYETVRRLLGHTSVETTITFYAEFDGMFARRKHADLINDLKLKDPTTKPKPKPKSKKEKSDA